MYFMMTIYPVTFVTVYPVTPVSNPATFLITLVGPAPWKSLWIRPGARKLESQLRHHKNFA